MRKLLSLTLSATLALCAGMHSSTVYGGNDSQLCGGGTIAFVQWRNQADIAIRFVTHNEDVRINFTGNRDTSGTWRVVGRNQNPDLRVYVDTYQRSDSVNVKIVDNNPGCN